MQKIIKYIERILDDGADEEQFYLGQDNGKYVKIQKKVLYWLAREKWSPLKTISKSMAEEGLSLERVVKDIALRKLNKKFKSAINAALKSFINEIQEPLSVKRFDLTDGIQLKFDNNHGHPDAFLKLSALTYWDCVGLCIGKESVLDIRLTGSHYAVPPHIRKMIIDWWKQHRGKYWKRALLDE